MSANTSKRANGRGSVFQRKDGRWAAKIPVPGRPRPIIKYAKTEEAAWAVLNSALLDRGLFVSQEDARDLTVEQWLTHWLRTKHGAVEATTYRGYEVITRRHLIPLLGPIPLQHLTKELVNAMIDTLLHGDPDLGRRAYAPKSVLEIRSVLRQALDQAHLEGKVRVNAARRSKVPLVEDPDIQPLTADEVHRLLDAFQGNPNGALFVLTVGTAMRRAEVAGLIWRNVDFTRGTIRVTQQLVREDGQWKLRGLKSSSSRRTIVAPRLVIDALRLHKAEQDERRKHVRGEGDRLDLVFTTGRGTPHHPDNLGNYLERALRRAGLEPRRFHDLRHTAATLMLEDGIDMRHVQAILGHADVATTLRYYAHVRPAGLEHAARVLDGVLSRPATVNHDASGPVE
jgi:integrase